MVATLLRLVGFDLQRHIDSLKLQAEEFKLRTAVVVKRQVAVASMTIGIAFVGLMLGLLTVIIALLALYLWVAMVRGPFVGLAVVGSITAVLAAVLFAVAVRRGIRTPSTRPLGNAAGAAQSSTGSSSNVATPNPSSAVDIHTQGPANGTAATTDDALDLAVETIRTGPREALLAALAIAVVIGVVAGRGR
jgi:hypothetical protein